MKEEKIDKYLGKLVVVVDFESEPKRGILYKIENHEVIDHPIGQYFVPINKGYYLDCPLDYNMCYRKSHIKKIYVML